MLVWVSDDGLHHPPQSPTQPAPTGSVCINPNVNVKPHLANDCPEDTKSAQRLEPLVQVFLLLCMSVAHISILSIIIIIIITIIVIIILILEIFCKLETPSQRLSRITAIKEERYLEQVISVIRVQFQDHVVPLALRFTNIADFYCFYKCWWGLMLGGVKMASLPWDKSSCDRAKEEAHQMVVCARCSVGKRSLCPDLNTILKTSSIKFPVSLEVFIWICAHVLSICGLTNGKMNMC